MVNCIICNNKLKSNQRKFCSRKCTDKNYYLKNKEKCIQNAKDWYRRNPNKVKKIRKYYITRLLKKEPDYFNKRNLKYYYAHKDKHNMRANTNLYRTKILSKFNNKCEGCCSIEKLEIHHLDYSWDKKYQRKRSNLKINLHKVKVLCRTCHRKEHRDT